MNKVLKIVGLIWLVITGYLAGLVAYGMTVPVKHPWKHALFGRNK